MKGRKFDWDADTFDAPLELLKSLRSNIYYRKKKYGELWDVERIAGISDAGDAVPMLRITRVVE